MPQPPTSAGTPIHIVIGDTVITAELWDNAPARALIDRLPLTLDFSDLNAVEKIARLDPALPMTGMPDGDDPAPRDIGWYAPSSDVVLYYGDVGYWPGIARIGHISGDIDTIADQAGRLHRHHRTRDLTSTDPPVARVYCRYTYPEKLPGSAPAVLTQRSRCGKDVTPKSS